MVLQEEYKAVEKKLLGNKFAKKISDNIWVYLFFALIAYIMYSLIAQAAEHKNNVQTISTQNAACIYLESSKLGDGQHYMICDGQIVLKRIADEVPTATPEQKLEEVVPTKASTTK